MLELIATVVALLSTLWLLSRGWPIAQNLSTTKSTHDGLTKLQHACAWINSLAKANDTSVTARSNSPLSSLAAGREVRLLELQGFVEIGDLCSYPKLELSTSFFVSATQDFDSNVHRLDEGHRSMISQLQALVKVFKDEFNHIHQSARAWFHQSSNPRLNGMSRRRTTTRARQQHQQLVTELRNVKTHLCLVAKIIKHATFMLHEDTMAEINMSPLYTRQFLNNTLFLHQNQTQPSSPTRRASQAKSLAQAATNALRSLNFIQDHHLELKLVTSLVYIASTQRLIDDQIVLLVQNFANINDILTDFIHEISNLNLENIMAQGEKVTGLISKLDDIVKNAKSQI